MEIWRLSLRTPDLKSVIAKILLAPDIGWTHLLRRLSVVNIQSRELSYEAIHA